MSFQAHVLRAEAFLETPWKHGVPALRSMRGKLIAYRHPVDGKIIWNIDLYDVAGRVPMRPELAALLLLMDDRQCATGAMTVKERRLKAELAALLGRRVEITVGG